MQQRSPMFHAVATAKTKRAKKPATKPVAARVPYKLDPKVIPVLKRKGMDAGLAYFNGDTEALKRLIADAHTHNARISALGSAAAFSGISTLADLLASVQNTGRVKFVPILPTTSHLSYLALLGYRDFWGANGAGFILCAADNLRRARPDIKAWVSRHDDSPALKPEVEKQPVQQQPQRIEIIKMPPQPPLEVRLIAMPARETVMTVERDSDSEIARTLHKERDA